MLLIGLISPAGVWTLIYDGPISQQAMNVSAGGPWPGCDVQRTVVSFSDYAYVLGGYFSSERVMRWSYALEKFVFGADTGYGPFAGRRMQDAVTWVDDTTKKFYMFGGDAADDRTSQYSTFYSGSWRSGPQDILWTALANGPPARARAQSWSDNSGNLWLYGGCSVASSTGTLLDVRPWLFTRKHARLINNFPRYVLVVGVFSRK